GLRGADSDADRAHVQALCAELGVPLVAARWNMGRRMRTRGLSGEAGLRTLRREFLIAATRRAGADAIATAHTADDQLETLLMRIARGTGLRGLGAMAPRRGPWIKPLLLATRRDVEHDLTRAGIAWREDASNAGRAYLRNRIRHDVIPALEAAVGPPSGRHRATTSLGQDRLARDRMTRSAAALTAEIRSASRVLERGASRVLARVCRIQAGEFGLDSGRVATYPLAFRWTLLRLLWKRIAPASVGLTRRHLEAL